MRKSRKNTLGDTGIFHKMWQGHNGEAVLKTHTEKMFYLRCLRNKLTDKIASHIQLHSFCIMDTHPHEIGRVGWNKKIRHALKKGIAALGNWMRNAHSAFAQKYNRQRQRRGKISCERPKTIQIKSEPDVLIAMFYGDANPVRANLASHPRNYKFSTYRHYAMGEAVPGSICITHPPAYRSLGKTASERRSKYRRLCDRYLRWAGLLNDYPENSDEELLSQISPHLAVLEALTNCNNRRWGPTTIL